MAKGRREIPACCKKYGLPLYCAGWVPINKSAATDAAGDGDPAVEDQLTVVLGGGGGEGRSGVPNALLLSNFDFSASSLSNDPEHRFDFDGECPYRMAVHPGGDGIICSFPNSCRWFEWVTPLSAESPKLALKVSERILNHLEDVGLQLALAFNAEGSMLATGGEDGHLRVLKWPSTEIILDQVDAHTTVKDLDFSSDGKLLVSLGSSGPCRIWDLTSSTVIANLPRENGENFGFCRFSQSTDNQQPLYITAMHGEQASILSWDSLSWKRVGSKWIVRDPVSAFSVSTDGKLLAVGTIEGDVIILTSSNMRVGRAVKKAHLGIVTALAFSQDSRALVSTSFDSSARVTLTPGIKESGSSMWIVVLVFLLAILIYYMKFRFEEAL